MKEVTVERAMVLLSRVRVQMNTAVKARLFAFPSGSAWGEECAAVFDASVVPVGWPARLLADIDDLVGRALSRERALGDELSAALAAFVSDWQCWERVISVPEPAVPSLLQEAVQVRTALCELVRSLGPQAPADYGKLSTLELVRLFRVWAEGMAKSYDAVPSTEALVQMFDALDEAVATEIDVFHPGTALAVLFLVRETMRRAVPELGEKIQFKRTEAAVKP